LFAIPGCDHLVAVLNHSFHVCPVIHRSALAEGRGLMELDDLVEIEAVAVTVGDFNHFPFLRPILDRHARRL